MIIISQTMNPEQSLTKYIHKNPKPKHIKNPMTIIYFAVNKSLINSSILD